MSLHGMKTWNIWKYNVHANGPAGPWQYAGACVAHTETDAMNTARARYGLNGLYAIYEGGL